VTTRRQPLLVVSVVLLAAGVAVRVLHFAANRSLHIDEARLGLNVLTRSFTELLRPLEHDQAAPMLFLWLERTAVLIGGANEFALRVVPLLAGVGVLVGVHVVARRWLTPPGVCATTLAAAFSPLLVHYSNEAKQYGVEAAVTVALVTLGVRLGGRVPDNRGAAVFAGAAVVGALAAVPAVFVIGGIALALVGRWGVVRLLPGIVLGTSASFIWYHVAQRPVTGSVYMQRFWENSYLPPAGSSDMTQAALLMRDVTWRSFLGGPTMGISGTSQSIAMSVCAVAVAIICARGAYLMVSRCPRDAAMIVSPPVLAAVASAGGIYPFSARLLVFATPLFFLMYGAAFDQSSSRPPRLVKTSPTAWAVIVFGVIAAITTLIPAAWPYQWEESRPLVRLVQASKPSIPVYVYASGVPAWAFYTTDWAAPDLPRLRWLGQTGSSGGNAFENAPPRQRDFEPRDTAGLTRLSAGRLELIGAASGVQRRGATLATGLVADPGWATAESARVGALPSCRVWLMFTHVHPSAAALLDTLEAGGFVQVASHGTRGAYLFQYARC
jgi:hypothetical protein